jgi:hypothetical protein
VSFYIPYGTRKPKILKTARKHSSFLVSRIDREVLSLKAQEEKFVMFALGAE